MPAMSHTLVPSCACPSPSLRAKDALVSARQATRFARTRNSSTPRVEALAGLDCIASQGDLARVRRGAAAQQARRNSPINATAAGARETRQPKSSALATPPASNTIYPRAQPPADQKVALTRRRLRIAVDVDEVIAQFVLALNNFCDEEHDMQYKVSDYSVYDFKTVWNCSQQESNELVHAFFESKHFHHGVPVIPGAEASLRRLGKSCDLMVVTSRQHVIQEPTLIWLDQNFPGVFPEVHFGNHFALEGTSRKKSEICREIKADVLIDDNPGYAMDCAEAGMQVLLFDWNLKYPWAKTEECGPHHSNITRVSDWAAVEAMLSVFEQTLASPTEVVAE